MDNGRLIGMILGVLFITSLSVLICGAIGYGVGYLVGVTNKWIFVWIGVGVAFVYSTVKGVKIIYALRKVEKQFGNFKGLRLVRNG
ncbi:MULTISPECIES: hypothetical protein [Bacillaceae]|uniref:Uncharacterized protein n=1 Tax=Evansella alkalicola TaxID=745819 RepID=A0ABS6JZW0_9BACI|nr:MULTISPECIES: hypothetical protein [Bacillaceae]MBU9724136.1 hypothetical protein [Bacillus alkalicola]